MAETLFDQLAIALTVIHSYYLGCGGGYVIKSVCLSFILYVCRITAQVNGQFH